MKNKIKTIAGLNKYVKIAKEKTSSSGKYTKDALRASQKKFALVFKHSPGG